MHTLESLLKSIILKVQPQCLKKSLYEKNKYRNISLLSLLLLTGVCLLEPFIFADKQSVWAFIGCLAGASFLVGALFSWISFEIAKDSHKEILHIHNTFSDKQNLIGLFYDNNDRLNQEETEILLNMQLSKETLKILHDTISENGYITYHDVAKMYYQDYSENKVVNNQKNFIQSGSFNTVNQQQNLEGLLLDMHKASYKQFNSKSIL